jgi:CBS domain-containing protein
MSRPVAVAADLHLGDALGVMVRGGLRHVIVVDDADRCLGVVGDRAITSAWATDPTALACTRVDHLLERRRAVVAATATVRDVAMMMHGDGVDAVAVIDEKGRCVGMVTGGDLVALLAA